MNEEAKTVVDGLAVSGTVATMAGWLPPLASALTIIWLSIRIWESETVQSMVRKRDD
mgnify:CR=1 FL=1